MMKIGSLQIVHGKTGLRVLTHQIAEAVGGVGEHGGGAPEVPRGPLGHRPQAPTGSLTFSQWLV